MNYVHSLKGSRVHSAEFVVWLSASHTLHILCCQSMPLGECMLAKYAFVTDCVAFWPSTVPCNMPVHILGLPCRCGTAADHTKRSCRPTYCNITLLILINDILYAVQIAGTAAATGMAMMAARKFPAPPVFAELIMRLHVLQTN